MSLVSTICITWGGHRPLHKRKGKVNGRGKMKAQLTMDTAILGSSSLGGVRGMRVETNECFEVRKAIAA